MIGGVVDGLLAGWVLSWFGFEETAINGFKELFNMTLSVSTYYFLFSVLGILGSLIKSQKTIDVHTKDTDESNKIKPTKYYN